MVSSVTGSETFEEAVPSHWIWEIKGDDDQDRIDVLLAAGGIPKPQYTSWLLWDAITENRYGRFQMLLKAGESLESQVFRLRKEQVQAMRQMYPIFGIGILDDEGFNCISPLRCAVFYERHEMIEVLLRAGAVLYPALGSRQSTLPPSRARSWRSSASNDMVHTFGHGTTKKEA